MNSLEKNVNGIILCLFEIIVGIILMINPVEFTTWIIMLAGIVLIAIGVVNVVKYFRTNAKEACLEQTLTKGLLSLISGGFCLFEAQWFVITFPVLTIVFGIAILVTGIGKIQLSVDMIRFKNKKWFLAVINAVVSVVCAVVILKSPFASTTVLWMFTGASLIAEGLLDIVTMIVGKKTGKGNNV